MLYSEGTFKSGGQLDLFYRAWLPEAGREARAVIAVVHGAGEHSGRHANLGRIFAEQGYAVFAYDLRGHGRSPGRRGHVARFAEYINDTGSFLDFIRRQNPEKKVYLLGHSLGGLIAASYVLEPIQLSGLILSSPLMRIKMHVPGWKTAIGQIASHLMPALTMKSGLPAADLCRNPEVGINYRQDPLVHDLATVRFYTEMLSAQSRALAHAGELKVPLLVLYGSGDRIVDPASVRLFYDKAGSVKTIRCYAGFFHEIFNETDSQIVFEDVLGWLK